MRYLHPWGAMAQMAKAGQIGQLFFIQGDYIHDMWSHYAPQGKHHTPWRIDKQNPQNILLGGGCHPALTADVRFAADDAVFGQPEILLGIIPGAGGTQRLSRLVGPSRAKELIFSGRFVPAEEALAIGLVDRVLPADQVYAEAVAWAAQFSQAAAYALRAAKEAVDRGLEVDLETGLEIERQQFAALFATEDRTIGMTSFIENGPGKASFVGR